MHSTRRDALRTRKRSGRARTDRTGEGSLAIREPSLETSERGASARDLPQGQVYYPENTHKAAAYFLRAAARSRFWHSSRLALARLWVPSCS